MKQSKKPNKETDQGKPVLEDKLSEVALQEQQHQQEAARVLDLRINNLFREMETELPGEVSRRFVESLRPGELFKVLDIIPGVQYYSVETFSPVKVHEEISPGDIIMYLGTVPAPGEKVVIYAQGATESPVERTLFGPKWLINGKVSIRHISMSSLEPMEIDIEPEVLSVLEVDSRKKI